MEEATAPFLDELNYERGELRRRLRRETDGAVKKQINAATRKLKRVRASEQTNKDDPALFREQMLRKRTEWRPDILVEQYVQKLAS